MPDWNSIIGPAVVAALVSATIAVVGLAVNRATVLRTHKEKIEADIALAERKLALDRELADWTRRTEIAERVLADFYRARDIFAAARDSISLLNEGITRDGRLEGETEEEARYRDAIYVPYERLSRDQEFFAEMHARRFRFMALFGAEAAEPFLDIVRSYSEVHVATGALLTSGNELNNRSLERCRTIIGWGITDHDPIKDRIDAAVNSIEQICWSVLGRTPE